MEGKKIVVAGILSGVVILCLSMAFSTMVQGIWDFDMMKLAGMREVDDPLMVLFFVHPWVLGFTLAIVYSYCGKALKGTSLRKGVFFGFLMWLVVALPSAVLVFSSMNYPNGFTVNSVIGPLIYLIVSGAVIGKIFEWMK